MEQHRNVIHDFLRYMNGVTHHYILKGGTSLMECYGLDRMSEDIDLDSTDKETIRTVLEKFCKDRGYSYNVNKDTDTVKRFMVHYQKDEGLEANPLKVEVSYRRREISHDEFCEINGITVYNIDRIASMKENAFASRDKIRDLYDVVFICKRYWDELSGSTRNIIRDGFENKGLEYFDYITATQHDVLIDPDKLGDDLLDVFDRFGLITGKETEQEILPVNKQAVLMEEGYKNYVLNSVLPSGNKETDTMELDDQK